MLIFFLYFFFSNLFMMYLQFESVSTERDIIHAKPAPSIEWHLTKDKEQFDLLTVSVGNKNRDLHTS